MNSFTGQLATWSTANGKVPSYADIRAESAAVTASGMARLQNPHIKAELSVDGVDSVVCLPLKINRPASKLAVRLPAGLLPLDLQAQRPPGMGTAIGAWTGTAIGSILDDDEKLERVPALVRRRPDRVIGLLRMFTVVEPVLRYAGRPLAEQIQRKRTSNVPALTPFEVVLI